MSSLSRRNLVTSVAVLPAVAVLPVAAVAHEPDPIFAAIERHRKLDAETMAADNEWSTSHRADLKAKTERLEERAAGALAEIAPTTPAGAGALVAYVNADLVDGETDWHQPALANAARALSGMAGTAALPAAAMPALASDAMGPNHPDAELLRLGAELEAVIVDWHAQRAIDRKRSAAIHTALEAAGLSDIDHRSLPDDEFRAYLAKRDAVTGPIYRAGGNVNEDGEEVDIWDDIHGRMWPMIDAIMATSRAR